MGLNFCEGPEINEGFYQVGGCTMVIDADPYVEGSTPRKEVKV